MILPLQLDAVSYEVKGQRLLRDLDFTVDRGPLTIVVGPNGAGKSLTLRICHGLLAPTRGRVRWLGPDAGQATHREAMVFQRPVLLRRTALANVEYALSLRGLARPERRRRADEALERTGLTRLSRRPARALSVGEQQRLALARAWALDPEVLFLDEPTASLDPAATLAVEGIVRAIHESGKKIVMTTHDLGQARRLADEVLFLHEGRLVERAAAEDFFRKPQSDVARAFLAGELSW